jgi:hypothetical protein
MSGNGWSCQPPGCFVEQETSGQKRLACCEKSNSFDDDSDTLADADTHGAQGVTSTAVMQLVDCGSHQPRAAGTERMAERDRTTVGIDAFVVIGQTKIAQYRQALGAIR